MGNDLFEKAPIPKAYFSFALPVVFSMVISLVYNMADTYFIAATGNTNLVAGVSLGAPIFTLMIALGDIFGLGGSSVISRLFGKKMDEDGKRLSVFCFYGAIVCGIVVAVLMMLFRAPILTLLGAKADTVQYASDYYTWLVIGAPFIILSFTPSNLLRTEGFSVASMTGTVLGSVINIILDPIFIFVLGMGAAGAAIATVIGNIGADLCFVFFVLILPMWMNFILRILAWQMILSSNGILNLFLTKLGFQPLAIANTWVAILIGVVYDYLPYMVLPIYNSIMEIDEDIVEAARDLGAGPRAVFGKVIFPLSLPGLMSGIVMVFVPSMTSFVVSDILGGGKLQLIGNVIEQEFLTNMDWHMGSGLSVMLMIFVLITTAFTMKNDTDGRSSAIW